MIDAKTNKDLAYFTEIEILQNKIFKIKRKIEEVNLKKEDNREVSSKFKENQFKDEKYMKFMAAQNFILLSKPECFKQIESAQNMLSNERKKLLSILSSTIKSLSDLKPDLSDLEIEIVKEILDYRNIEYEDM